MSVIPTVPQFIHVVNYVVVCHLNNSDCVLIVFFITQIFKTKKKAWHLLLGSIFLEVQKILHLSLLILIMVKVFRRAHGKI